jgi:DNA-binding transcriptional LysR family regulator
MITFKQLEAIYWIGELGGFSQAAAKLHTTQSAVSKRINELEALLDVPLFDRTQRSAQLTDKGEEMFVVAKAMLEQRELALQRFRRPEEVERRVRLGVTELTAMTWLPRFVDLIQQNYPKVVIEPDVDMSVNLREKLVANQADIVIVPEPFSAPDFVARVVGQVQNAWMCKPGIVVSAGPIRLTKLAAHRLLIESEQSGTGLMYSRWLKSIGVQPGSALRSNNLIARIGMTVSGLGISYLPLKCVGPLVNDGRLQVLKVTPRLPDVVYVAMHKREQRGSLFSSIVGFAREACDFDRMFQAVG